MPWTPEDDGVVPGPRLDPFRERAGVLVDSRGGKAADVFLRVETAWSRVSGHLWWSRWSAPGGVVRVFVLRDGRLKDRLSTGEQLDADLEDWASGSFAHLGVRYRVVWQDDEESARVREELFGLDPLTG